MAITAAGVISPLGEGIDEIVGNIREGKTRFSRPAFDPSVAMAEVGEFEIKKYTGRNKNLKYLNRGACLGVAAAMSALRQAGLDDSTRAGAGLFCAAGPNLDLGGEMGNIENGALPEKDLQALWVLRFLPNTASSAIALLGGIHGENLTVGTACAASLQAVGEAFRKVRDGYLHLALAGGGDSRLNPGGILAYKKARALLMNDGEPADLYPIFDQRRDGFIPGEGGAFFLLETLEHATQRNANILAEIMGYGCSLDGRTMTAPDPEAIQPEKAIRDALRDAGVSTAEIGLICAHGTGTPLNDDMEVNLISRVFGQAAPSVVALKSWIGHLASACGAVELAICLGFLKTGWLPAIRNLDHPVDHRIRFVTETRREMPTKAIIQNFGFGGQNAALVIKGHAPADQERA